jgi:methionine sulfoxide reductase heme-binding subunit
VSFVLTALLRARQFKKGTPVVANPIAQKINGVLRKMPSWPLYIIGFIPFGVYFYWAVTNQLGADPLARLEHQIGEWALQLLILTLLVSPIRKLTGISFIKFRRAFGLMAFFYVCLHLSVWVALDKSFLWGEIIKDLYKRPYIIIGMTAFTVLIPMALTSNNRSIRKFGPKVWGRIHMLGYVATAAGALHYMMLVKAWPLEPIVYCLIVAGLLLWRVKWPRFLRFASSN